MDTTLTKRQRNLGRLLRPRHIAYIGGSQAMGSLLTTKRAGFKGEIWAVNPNREELGGVKSYPSIEDLPEPPDAALLALSPTLSVEAVRSLAAIGAGGAVTMAAGFAELADDEGRGLQAALKEAAGDLAVLGPNCMGVLNLFDGAAIWGVDNHLEQPGDHGSAIISQSGAFLFGATNVEQVTNLGYGISTGNQAVIEIADCIEALLEDNRVCAIGIYLEGLENGNALGKACWRALKKGVPIIALKGGDTPAGATVALGHTGAMVVDSDLWRAFADRYGIVEVSSPKAMVETLKFLSIAGIPKGNALSTITFSGGLNGLIASRAADMGLELPQPTPENIQKLKAQLPKTVPVSNPLDLNLPWASKTGMSLKDGDDIAQAITNLAADAADMVTFFLDVPRPDENAFDQDWLPSIYSLEQVGKTLGIPCAVAGIMPEGLDVGLRQRLKDKGIAPLLGFSDAMEALSVSGKVAAVHKQKSSSTAPNPLLETSEQSANTKMLNEHQGKERLEPYGLKFPARAVSNAVDAAATATSVGYPVAVKILSDKISHKAQIGGVALNLKSEDDVSAAVKNIQQSVKAAGMDDHADAFLIERMIEGPIAEFIIGIRKHPAMGLAIVLGRGGVAVEKIKQFTTLLLPLNKQELKVAMECLHMEEGAFGHDAIYAAVGAVAAFAMDHADEICEVDINPLILTATGEAIAADAFMVMNDMLGEKK